LAAVPVWLTEPEYRILVAVCDRLIPADGDRPGAVAAGAPDYIDTLLGAFTFDPPRIWAGGPTSGRHGGPARFADFVPLGALDELAWRTRIEGSLGRPEREFNGPVVGLQQRYRAGLAALGQGFCDEDRWTQSAALRADPAFSALVFAHTCEGMYGAPEYGGNRDGAAWSAIGFAGDVQPRGFTDAEVSGP
jgi:hypothetical protein